MLQKTLIAKIHISRVIGFLSIHSQTTWVSTSSSSLTDFNSNLIILYINNSIIQNAFIASPRFAESYIHMVYYS